MGLRILVFVTNIWRSILSICKVSPGFFGERIVWKWIVDHAKQGDQIRLGNGFITINGASKSFRYPILDFVPHRGISIALEEIDDSPKLLRNVIKGDNKKLDFEYFSAFRLYLLTTYGSILCNIVVVFEILSLFEIESVIVLLISLSWLISNSYFIIQLFIYHFSRLKSIIVCHVFEEAHDDEISTIIVDEHAPHVVSVIPAHNEDDKLLRNSLYSHVFQRYPNRQVVLLLGSDYYSRDLSVQQGIQKNIMMFNAIRNEMLKNQFLVENQLCQFKDYSLKNVITFLPILSEVYASIASWFEIKCNELKQDSDAYPTKEFLLQHTFVDQIEFYLNLQKEIQYFGSAIYHLDSQVIEERMKYYIKGCRSVFNCSLRIFQRYKYDNVEHEKTKAGNLTAYLSLLGKKWHEEISGNRFEIRISEDDSEEVPDYVGVFDSDTIVKAQYVIRKVAFLKRTENDHVGLIQSPYCVPVPEPTNSASASGVHSYWFLPLSIGMSVYNSAFWLGFNGLFRGKAVASFGGSFKAETLIEDLENSLKLIQNGYSIVTSPEYQCQTFSPPDMHSVHIQRERWASGGFRIGYNYLRDIFMGKYQGLHTLEWMYRLNYILGLNILPLVVTITLVLESPRFNPFYGVETIPFFFYLMTYGACLRPSAYRLKHYLDGLAVTIFMNFHYLRGTWTSLKVLFRKEESQFFKATPRSKNLFKRPLGKFEIVSFAILIPLYLYRIISHVDAGNFGDVVPLYTILCFFYGSVRLIGGSSLFRNIIDVLKVKKEGDLTKVDDQAIGSKYLEAN